MTVGFRLTAFGARPLVLFLNSEIQNPQLIGNPYPLFEGRGIFSYPMRNIEDVMVQLKLRSSYWIVDADGNIIIGKGRAEILKNIEKTGSINQAAKIMKMSYKGVWSKIKATEKHLNQKIVLSDRKEGTRLTPRGKELLAQYKLLEKTCMASDDKIFSRIFK
jgi:molybdate transport system regulatory protein